MGWKGALKSARATVRRVEREAKRRQRELEYIEKESRRHLEREQAAHEVAVYENYLDRITSIHIDIGEPIDWRSLAEAPEPALHGSNFSQE